MPQPAETFYFAKPQGELLHRGLQVLVNGVATFIMNGHLSKDLFFSSLINLFQPRECNGALATQTRLLRNRVRRSLKSGGRRLRLKYHDVVVLQLALRIARRKSPSKGATQDLEGRLEALRKRLKRAVISRFGRDFYRAQQHRWTLHRHWLRLNVLLERRPRKASVSRPYVLQQHETLLALTRELVAKYFAQPLPEEEIVRIVDLAFRHLRRGRYKVPKFRLLLEDPAAFQEFMFEFMRQRGKLKLKYEFMPKWEQMAERGERFRQSMTIDSDPEISTAPAPPPITVPLPVPAAPEKPPITNEQIVARIAQFFLKEVPQQIWDQTEQQVRYFGGAHPDGKQKVQEGLSLDELIAITRPRIQPESIPDEINFYSEWLLAWVPALVPVPEGVCSLIREGWRAARAHPIDQAVNQRYISGSSWGRLWIA
jgi:hypothetical protein